MVTWSQNPSIWHSGRVNFYFFFDFCAPVHCPCTLHDYPNCGNPSRIREITCFWWQNASNSCRKIPKALSSSVPIIFSGIRIDSWNNFGQKKRINSILRFSQFLDIWTLQLGCATNCWTWYIFTNDSECLIQNWISTDPWRNLVYNYLLRWNFRHILFLPCNQHRLALLYWLHFFCLCMNLAIYFLVCWEYNKGSFFSSWVGLMVGSTVTETGIVNWHQDRNR